MRTNRSTAPAVASDNAVESLIAPARNGLICNECVELLHDIEQKRNRRSGNITKSRIKPEELKRIDADITRMREDATGASTGSNVSSKSSAEGLKRETKPSPRAMPARRVVPAALLTVAGTTTTTAHRASIQRPRRTAKDVAHLCFLIVAAVVYYFVGKLILLIAGFILFVRGNSGRKRR
jgi:hypothetical protein